MRQCWTRKKEEQGGRRDKEEGGARKKEGRGGRKGEEEGGASKDEGSTLIIEVPVRSKFR